MNKRIQKKFRARELRQASSLTGAAALTSSPEPIPAPEDQHDQEFETAPQDGAWDATGDDTPWISPEDATAHGANVEEQAAADLAETRPYGDIVEPENVPSTTLLSQAARALDTSRETRDAPSEN